MRINKEILKSFNPCIERWKNFLAHYSEFDGDYDEFLELSNISYDDKIWVSKKLLNNNQLVHAAVLCAESVLFIFEKKLPDDKRIHDCLSFMKSIVEFSSMTNEQRERLSELRGGVWESKRAAATAYADAYAAAYDAAAAAYAAADNAYNAYNAADARVVQQNKNLELFKMAAKL